MKPVILRMLIALLIVPAILAGHAYALEDSEVNLETGSEWITAGGSPATITAVVSNASVTVSGVDFSCTEPLVYGDTGTATDSSVPYTTTFASTKSGTATIEATVRYNEDGVDKTLTKTVTQKIDHAAPDILKSVSYKYEVTIDQVTPVIIRLEDRYGNLIDSKKEDALGGIPESVYLYSSPEDSGFWDGTGYNLNDVQVFVNNDGDAELNFKVSATAGNNVLTIVPPNDIEIEYRTVIGLANAVPERIVVGVNPHAGDPPFIPADGETKFYITYILEDTYGNPAGNRTIHISSSDPTDLPFERTSNSAGQVMITYGPRSQKGLVTLTAYSVDTPSLTVSTDLVFDSTEPVDMLLTANPEMMPASDVAPLFKSKIRAKVIDEKGNPVKNEMVNFSIIHGTYPASQVIPPSLETDFAVTDEDGQAIVNFIPGAFITDWNDPNYEKLASASCSVRAEWSTSTRTIELGWKNYPYITVETSVSPETVELGGDVDVTVRLIGDGWALQPDPIDVILSADRSGSMLKDNPDRMVSLIDALKIFNSEMAEGRDQVGITSFGVRGVADIYAYGYKYWSGYDSTSWDDSSYISSHYIGNGKWYANYATLDLPLTTDHSMVENEVDRIVPMSGTPMRGGLYLSIKEIAENARSDAVRAVVLLSDGDYNWYGDPLARGSGYTWYHPDDYSTLTKAYYKFTDLPYDQQDMSEYANSNNVKIYSIAFGDSISSGGRYVLEQLAERTGGTYYYAPTGDDLAGIYSDIAGDLKTEAGVDTIMDLQFDNVELNNVSIPNNPLDPVLEYVYLDNVSTTIESWDKTGIVIPRNTVDDTSDWTDDLSLNFDVGTIKLNQVWETNFRLKALKPGNINIFGPGSTISFNNGTDVLTLPKTYVTAVPDLNMTGIEFTGLEVSGLHATNTGEIVDTLNLEWSLKYSGEYPVTQNLYYMKIGDNVWIPFKSMPSLTGPLDKTETAGLSISGLPPGSYYIRVHASAPDTPDSIVETEEQLLIGEHSASYIKIE
ncbi:hypothetical protein F1737_09155 [Methanoplanus sp. FWC-SCC4]|uniref:VWFA domain-containing protein n=1 Tax=Methanochimaera problematica TaxID=2609417 RepID=A0AA97I3L6_9EURY|nr:hypothetical protein [Methanoplanus sp. FWC-SCC4]WOF16843.1 hypothetical protein F1737_09155 [Methanoplanus sp. FWC-SCC4]